MIRFHREGIIQGGHSSVSYYTYAKQHVFNWGYRKAAWHYYELAV